METQPNLCMQKIGWLRAVVLLVQELVLCISSNAVNSRCSVFTIIAFILSAISIGLGVGFVGLWIGYAANGYG